MSRRSALPSPLHIETLRVRLPAADAGAGRRFAAELGAELSRQAAALASNAGSAPVALDGLKLSLRSGAPGPSARQVGSTLLRAIERAASVKPTRTR